MRFLKGLTKLIQAILVFLMPIVIFYWFLTLIVLEFVKPFTVTLGSIFTPIISFLKSYNSFEVSYEGTVVDFSLLALSILLLLGFFVFMGIEKLIDFAEHIIIENEKKAKKAALIHQQELQKMKIQEELAKNKIIYLVLKFRKKETSNAYLYEGREDFFAEGILGTMINDILNNSKDFKAIKHQEFVGDDDTHNFIFYNITEAIDYAFYTYNKVIEINREVLDQSKKLDFWISCHCAYNELNAQNDLTTTAKMLNLGKDNEIVVSEVFKNKYQALKNESNLSFTSKGLYNIDDKEIEIFILKAK